MPHADPTEFIKAILIHDTHVERKHLKEKNNQLIITISRDYGAEGEKIAEMLHSCLGLPVYQNEILEKVAQKAKVDKFLFEQHDENVSGGISSFIYSLIHGAPADMQTYRRALYDVVLDLAQHNGIIVGRGGHFILSGKKVFRLRIVGSLKKCAERVASELNIGLDEAERKVADINHKRASSIKALFEDRFPDAYLNNPNHFDLTINTDHISAEGAVPIILLALRQAGFAPVLADKA
ncbi:MAG: cytidylate kinase-like family protein [Methylococcaceae bacterium]|nr:MAG: cytidylate kinase-like family protein [Methylococcaceae bacterium]